MMGANSEMLQGILLGPLAPLMKLGKNGNGDGASDTGGASSPAVSSFIAPPAMGPEMLAFAQRIAQQPFK